MTRTSLRGMLPGVLALALGACASPAAQPAPYPPDAYAHRVATSHVVLYWNCGRPEAGILRGEGVAQNPWSSQEVRFLEVEVVGVDNRERTVSHAKGAAQDILIRTNQFSPFQMELRPAGSEVRFDLYYEYRFQDVEEQARLAGPLVGAPRLLAQTQRFLARDACSETQHRAR
ncbi:MAG: hypothetical protein AAB254_10960 [candidate division NC10 bacterium]